MRKVTSIPLIPNFEAPLDVIEVPSHCGIECKYLISDGTTNLPIDVSQWVVYMQVYKLASDYSPVISYSSITGGVTPASDGSISVTVSPTDLAAVPEGFTRLPYDVIAITPTTETLQLAKGFVYLSSSYSKVPGP